MTATVAASTAALIRRLSITRRQVQARRCRDERQHGRRAAAPVNLPARLNNRAGLYMIAVVLGVSILGCTCMVTYSPTIHGNLKRNADVVSVSTVGSMDAEVQTQVNLPARLNNRAGLYVIAVVLGVSILGCRYMVTYSPTIHGNLKRNADDVSVSTVGSMDAELQTQVNLPARLNNRAGLYVIAAVLGVSIPGCACKLTYSPTVHGKLERNADDVRNYIASRDNVGDHQRSGTVVRTCS